MDISLAILFVVAALYSGGVTFLMFVVRHGLRPAVTAGTIAAAGIAAALFLIVLLAQVSLVAAGAAVLLLVGTVAYLALVRDLDRRRAVPAAVAVAVAIGLSFAFVSYLGVLAFLGATGFYLLLRLRLQTRPALLVTGGALGGLLAASGAIFAVALSGM
jgi:hypothetical protein